MKPFLIAAAAAACLQAAPALAGPVADFDQSFGDMYSSYRAALFATNSGDAEKSGKALQALDNKWNGLVASYSDAPPPQYEDDPQWPVMVAEISGYLKQAESEAESGDLSVAHVTLEGIREAVSALHARNGIETFSDRMNAYHAEMEHVLELDVSDLDTAGMNTMLEHAGVLAYLANDILVSPPAQALGNAEYETLSGVFQTSVDQFVIAVRANDAGAIGAAVAGLKVPYSKLFLKFG